MFYHVMRILRNERTRTKNTETFVALSNAIEHLEKKAIDIDNMLRVAKETMYDQQVEIERLKRKR